MILIAVCAGIVLTGMLIAAANRTTLFSPLMLSAWSWLMVFASGLLFGGRYYPPTAAAVTMWIAWFVISGTIYLFQSGQLRVGVRPAPSALPFNYAPLLIVLNLWLAYRVWIVGKGGPAQFFFNLRLSSNQVGDYESLGAVGWLYPWIFALFLFEIANTREANRRLRILLWCWMMLYAFATMGKLSFLTPVLAWAVIVGCRGALPLRKLFAVGTLLFGVMFVLQTARVIGGERIEIGRFVAAYTYSPFVAFSYMRDVIGAPFGAHVFRFVYALQHQFLGGPEPVKVIQDYVAIPELSNVYTVMQPFAQDFGLVGVSLGAVVYGLLFGSLYRRAMAGHQLAMVLYAGLSVILAGQFIGEFLFTMFSGHLQFVIAATLILAVARRTEVDR